MPDAAMSDAAMPDAAADAQTADAPTDAVVDDAGPSGPVVAPPTWDCASDQAAILAGMQPMAFGGALPDTIIVWGPQACPVLVDGDGDTLMATAHHGGGRVAHISHESFIRGKLAADAAVQTWFDNVVSWFGLPAGATVGVDPQYAEAKARLAALGFVVKDVQLPDVAGAGVAAWVGSGYQPDDPTLAPVVEAWVAQGGRLLTGALAWWWASQNPGKDVASQNGTNLLLAPYGLTVAGDAQIGGANASPLPSPLPAVLHATAALALVEGVGLGTQAADQGTVATAVKVARKAVQALPIDGSWFALAAQMAAAYGDVIPTEADPVVQAEAPAETIVVTVTTRLALEPAAADVVVHPAAWDFPGPVTSDAQQVDVTLTVHGSYPGRDSDFLASGAGAPRWRAIGRYAPAGAAITVTIPPGAAGQGLALQIGAHTDKLWNNDQWRRCPEVVRRVPLDAATTVTASGFGGPMYVTVAPGSDLGPVPVTVQGGVLMAVYHHGEDAAADWSAELAAAQAPWAELGDDTRWMMTVPHAAAAQVADPAGLMAHWATALDLSAQLAAIPAERVRAERFCFDRQISAGYMHSGYPIMGPISAVAPFLDVALMKSEGLWGGIHELGHNHQYRPWVLPGTIEASCNLWSVRVHEELFGIGRDQAHPALSPSKRAERIDAYVAGGAKLGQWTVWTALETHLQLQEAFGWAFFESLFAAYQVMPQAEKPQTDAARIERFIAMSCGAAAKDLRPFFAAWGFAPGAEADTACGALPVWQDHPMTGL